MRVSVRATLVITRAIDRRRVLRSRVYVCGEMSCGVCLHDLTDARLLPCLHSFCRSCLDQLAVTAGPDNQVRCPSCRTPCRLPVDRGAAGLPRDSTKAKANTDGTCDVCWREDGERRPATVWCSECEVGLCAALHMVRHTLSTGKHVLHTVTAGDGDRSHVQQSPSLTMTRQHALRFQSCPQHGDPLKYFCKTCDVPVCGGCAAVGSHRPSQKHDIAQMSEVVEERRRASSIQVEKLTSQTQPCLEAAIAGVNAVSDRLSARAREVRGEILTATERVCATARAYEKQLVQQVDDTEERRLKVLDGQRDRLDGLLNHVKNAAEFSTRLRQSGATGDDLERFSLPRLVALEQRCKALNETDIARKPEEHERFFFQTPGDDLCLERVKESIGCLSLCPTSASKCVLDVELDCTVAKGDRCTVATLQAIGEEGVSLTEGGDCITATCVASSAKREAVSIEVEDKQDGRYEIRARPEEEGDYSLEIQVNGESLPHLVTFFCGQKKPLVFDPDQCNSNITISRNRLSATLNSERHANAVVLGNIGMRDGVHRWQVQIGPCNSWYLLGVTTKPLPSLADNRAHSQSFLTCAEATYTHGGAVCAASLHPLSENDTLQFDLDCRSRSLRATNVRSGNSAVITNLPDDEYFAFVQMWRPGNCVKLQEQWIWKRRRAKLWLQLIKVPELRSHVQVMQRIRAESFDLLCNWWLSVSVCHIG